jgi:hypothetical protein
MTSYRTALAFSIAGLLFSVLGLIAWVLLIVDTDELPMMGGLALAATYVAPCVLAVVSSARLLGRGQLLTLILALMYAGWVFVTTFWGGVLFWPAAAAMLAGSVIGIGDWLSRRDSRVLTEADIFTQH